VGVPENVDTIHSTILDDRRISGKKVVETLTISLERVSYNTHDNLDTRKLSAEWVSEFSMLSRSVIECLFHKQFWTDFGGIRWEL
jgi:hypothetical protein